MSDLTITTLGIAKLCSQSLNIQIDSIIECANGKLGNDLLYGVGVITHNLNPPLTNVPWININDIHTDQNQTEAENADLVKLVCDLYMVNFFEYLN